jgi:hypothetical protein
MQRLNSTNKTTLILLDAGLTNAGGHHFSTAELLLKALSAEQSCFAIKIVGSSGEWKSKLEDLYPTNTLIEHFSIDFYQHHRFMPSLAELTPYINLLCNQYKNAIDPHLKMCSNNPVFFCHTLDWDHFLALSIAIEQLQQLYSNRTIRCLAGLMFSPGCDFQGEILDKRKFVLAKIALRIAAHLPGLSVYASHFEIKIAITALSILLPRSVEFHPCLIADWRESMDCCDFDQKSNAVNLLLYAGDAKETKGFHQLPQLLKTHLQALRSDIQLVVQYSLAPKISSKLHQAVIELKSIAAQDQRVVIYDHYLSETLLTKLLKEADAFLFNYSADHYRNTSSGFLWHLAWHQVPMLTFNSSWMTREADRLGVKTDIIQQNEFCSFINTLHPRMNPQVKMLPSEYMSYYAALFSSPLEWLYQECKNSL